MKLKKFKITFNEGSHYNQIVEIKAENVKEALVKFNLTHPNNNEVVRIEEVS